uniref:Uncharacterized protein n=1 Tax=Chelydra serpentina TaxID=8475 RepID=A0A8C3SNJ8_CHESE
MLLVALGVFFGACYLVYLRTQHSRLVLFGEWGPGPGPSLGVGLGGWGGTRGLAPPGGSAWGAGAGHGALLYSKC